MLFGGRASARSLFSWKKSGKLALYLIQDPLIIFVFRGILTLLKYFFLTLMSIYNRKSKRSPAMTTAMPKNQRNPLNVRKVLIASTTILLALALVIGGICFYA